MKDDDDPQAEADLRNRLARLERENEQLRAQLTSQDQDASALASKSRELRELQEIYATAPHAMGLYDRDIRFIRINDRLAEINGVPAEAHIGLRPSEVLPEIGDAVEQRLAQVRDTGEPILGVEVTGTTPAEPTKQRTWIADWYPIKVGNQVVAVGASVRDITPQRELEQDLRNAMRELQHRVKNILANVGALVAQAKRSTSPPDEAMSILLARIKSLAQTHEVLTSADWRSASLVTIIKAELHDVYGEERVAVNGPDVAINARGTLAFAMAFHELATNAAKYGALSREAGKVHVHWLVKDGDEAFLELTWQEVGGPFVKEPSSIGFGQSLIDHSFTRTMGGRIHREYRPQGLICRVSVPMARLRREGASSPIEEVSFADPFS